MLLISSAVAIIVFVALSIPDVLAVFGIVAYTDQVCCGLCVLI